MPKLTKTQTKALDAIQAAGDAGLIRIGEVSGFHNYNNPRRVAGGPTVRKQTVDALVKAGLVSLDVMTSEYGTKTYTARAI